MSADLVERVCKQVSSTTAEDQFQPELEIYRPARESWGSDVQVEILDERVKSHGDDSKSGGALRGADNSVSDHDGDAMQDDSR